MLLIFGKEAVKPNFGGWKKNKTNAYSKNLFLFHPPGYSVAAQAIKSIYEKNDFTRWGFPNTYDLSSVKC